MKGMFLNKCDIYYQKCATAAQRFQLSMTKLGACDEIRWNDGTGISVLFKLKNLIRKNWLKIWKTCFTKVS